MSKYTKNVTVFDVEKWKAENAGRNPNLNQVMGTDKELFNHAWLQLRTGDPTALVINCEPYDREISRGEAVRLFKMIRENETVLLSMFGKNYLEINNYL